MKKLFLISICCLRMFETVAQINLVPNPSFEDTIQCPDIPGQIDYAPPWVKPNQGSSDLFHTCANGTSVGAPQNIGGNQLPRNGEAYAGIATFYDGANLREYIQTQLDSQLLSSKNYYVEFYVSLIDTQTVACNNIGAYFSSVPITGTSGQVLSFPPQVSNDPMANPLTSKTNWTKVSGSFIATGNENYITIGNFKDDISSDTTYIGGGCSGCDASGYYIDDVSVICIDCDTTAGINELENEMHFVLSPNPNAGEMNLHYSLDEKEQGTFSIYDVSGKLITTYNLKAGNDQLLFISESHLNNGMYFYKVIINGELRLNDKIVIIK